MFWLAKTPPIKSHRWDQQVNIAFLRRKGVFNCLTFGLSGWGCDVTMSPKALILKDHYILVMSPTLRINKVLWKRSDEHTPGKAVQSSFQHYLSSALWLFVLGASTDAACSEMSKIKASQKKLSREPRANISRWDVIDKPLALWRHLGFSPGLQLMQLKTPEFPTKAKTHS